MTRTELGVELQARDRLVNELKRQIVELTDALAIIVAVTTLRPVNMDRGSANYRRRPPCASWARGRGARKRKLSPLGNEPRLL